MKLFNRLLLSTLIATSYLCSLQGMERTTGYKHSRTMCCKKRKKSRPETTKARLINPISGYSASIENTHALFLSNLWKIHHELGNAISYENDQDRITLNVAPPVSSPASLNLAASYLDFAFTKFCRLSPEFKEDPTFIDTLRREQPDTINKVVTLLGYHFSTNFLQHPVLDENGVFSVSVQLLFELYDVSESIDFDELSTALGKIMQAISDQLAAMPTETIANFLQNTHSVASCNINMYHRLINTILTSTIIQNHLVNTSITPQRIGRAQLFTSPLSHKTLKVTWQNHPVQPSSTDDNTLTRGSTHFFDGYLHDMDTDQPRGTLTQVPTWGWGYRDAVFSPDHNKAIFPHSLESTEVWNLATNKQRCMLDGCYTACTPDGTKILTTFADSTAKIGNAETGALLLTLSGHTHPISTAHFSPHGTAIITLSDHLGTPYRQIIKGWDAKTGALRFTIHGNKISFSSDSTKFVAIMDTSPASYSAANIFEVETGRLLLTIKEKVDTLFRSAAFSPDGAYLVTTSSDKTAKIWLASTGTLLRTFSITISNLGDYGIIFSRDGTKVAFLLCEYIERIFDRTTKKFLSYKIKAPNEPYPLAGPNQTILSGGETYIRVFDISTGKQFFVMHREDLGGHVTSASFSHDETKIFTSGNDGKAEIWHLIPPPLVSKELSLEEALFLLLAKREQTQLTCNEEMLNIYHTQLNDQIRQHLHDEWHCPSPLIPMNTGQTTTTTTTFGGGSGSESGSSTSE